MLAKLKKMKIPKYRKHSARNLGFVEVNRKRKYFPGPYNSQDSLAAYADFIKTIKTDTTDTRPTPEPEKLSVLFLVLRYLEWAKNRYLKNGRSTGTYEKMKNFSQPLIELYSETPVAKFGPLALKHVRAKLLEANLCRNSINERIGSIRRIFQWGVSEELVPETVYRALMTVSMLTAGETSAVDYPPVAEAPLEDVLKTVAVCHKTLGDMIRVQLLSAMRPQEIRLMRSCDIDRSDDIWIYTPHEHKTQHKNKKRTIPILPESQKILWPYLAENEAMPEAYLFSPQKAVKAIAAEKRSNRKTPVQPSQQGRRKGRGKGRPIGDHYTKDAYGTAIERAAKRAGVPPWSPNQLRHTMATAVKNNLDIEAAQHLLGHSSPKTTEIYLDPNTEHKRHVEKVKEIARKIADSQQ